MIVDKAKIREYRLKFFPRPRIVSMFFTMTPIQDLIETIEMLHKENDALRKSNAELLAGRQ